MVNESYFPKDGYGLSAAVEAEGFKYPHLQLRNNINKQTKANTQRSECKIIDTENLTDENHFKFLLSPVSQFSTEIQCTLILYFGTLLR